MTDLCYGCQRDRHSQKDDTCLEPWEEVVQESYKESVVKLDDCLLDLKKVGDKLGVRYDFSNVNVKNDDLEHLVLKNCLNGELVALFHKICKKDNKKKPE